MLAKYEAQQLVGKTALLYFSSRTQVQCGVCKLCKKWLLVEIEKIYIDGNVIDYGDDTAMMKLPLWEIQKFEVLA